MKFSTIEKFYLKPRRYNVKEGDHISLYWLKEVSCQLWRKVWKRAQDPAEQESLEIRIL
jgi:hypothetical protein